MTPNDMLTSEARHKAALAATLLLTKFVEVGVAAGVIIITLNIHTRLYAACCTYILPAMVPWAGPVFPSAVRAIVTVDITF
jgi:hypothetical protein